MRSNALTAFWICLPMLIACIGVAVWNPSGDTWGPVEPPKAQCEAYDSHRMLSSTALTTEIYDSQKLNRVFREPQNTISNLAYIFAGVALLLASRRTVSRALAFACLFLGLGSGLYHASLLPEWRLIDILGVYAVLFCLLAVGCGAAFQLLGRRDDFLGTIAAWLLAIPAGIHRNDVRIAGVKWLDSTYVVVAAVVLASITALLSWRHVRNPRRYAGSLITLIVAAPLAFFGGIADRFGGLLANPGALIQGHSLWHTLGAVSLLAAYEIYASTGFDRSLFEPAAHE